MTTDISFGYGYKEFYDKAYYRYTEHDVKNNDPRSDYDMAEYYRNAGEKQKSETYYKKSFTAWQQYAKLGLPEACYFLGYFYQYGYGVTEDRSKAEEYYKQAYDEFVKYQGNPSYLYFLGRLYESGYYEGKLGKTDYKKASHYYSMAASFGYPDAFYRLGYIDALQGKAAN